MHYIMVIEKRAESAEVSGDIPTWPNVTAFLRHKLPVKAHRVTIWKYSSDGRTLGRLVVTMSNMVDVCLSLTDKVLTNNK